VEQGKVAASRSLPAAWLTVLRTCNAAPGRVDVVSRWLVLTRACVQPMTLTAAAVAGLLAARVPGFDPWLFALASVGIVLAHAANNLMNDLFDLESGNDTADYPRALYAPHPVLSGWITRTGLVRAAAIVNLIDLGILVGLTVARGWPIVGFALGGFVISAGYAAPPLRLKKHGLGEPGVFVVWGPLMVGGTYFAATGSLPWHVVAATIPYALLTTSVLMGKHIDKLPWDAGRHVGTLPAILGEERARRLNLALMVGFYMALAGLVGTGVLPVPALAAFGGLPLLAKVWKTYGEPRPTEPPPDYPVWPLWYTAAAFIHTRRAGALFVLGLAVAAVLPHFVGRIWTLP
jgi:1,4-dihydroxy-2-naphthoate octaprenyltransferase